MNLLSTDGRLMNISRLRNKEFETTPSFLKDGFYSPERTI